MTVKANGNMGQFIFFVFLFFAHTDWWVLELLISNRFYELIFRLRSKFYDSQICLAPVNISNENPIRANSTQTQAKRKLLRRLTTTGFLMNVKTNNNNKKTVLKCCPFKWFYAKWYLVNRHILVSECKWKCVASNVNIVGNRLESRFCFYTSLKIYAWPWLFTPVHILYMHSLYGEKRERTELYRMI